MATNLERRMGERELMMSSTIASPIDVTVAVPEPIVLRAFDRGRMKPDMRKADEAFSAGVRG